MWNAEYRSRAWSELEQPWDILIIGGGITGAGLFRMAVNAGLRTALVEAQDFTFGTSSRSSKLVHGGFRYLRNRQFSVTRQAVREREWLLREAKHLVTPLSFFAPGYDDYAPLWQLHLGVIIYDLLAPKWDHHRCTKEDLLREYPFLRQTGLQGACQYWDAHVDDSRLVLRLLREGARRGGLALNYARVERLLRDSNRQVCGALVRDMAQPNGSALEVRARLVINASGPWSDALRSQLGALPRLRKLRGSHLVFPFEKFPIREAVTLFHPRDRRAMFVIPWESVTIVGTTDLDHPRELEEQQCEPCASPGEIDYLMEAVGTCFPGLGLSHNDVIATFAGLRPVIRSERATEPSKESRAHVVWLEDGLLTVTGGKLTTFRIMATEALQTVAGRLGLRPSAFAVQKFFDSLPELPSAVPLSQETLLYLLGRYGSETSSFLTSATPDELQPIPGTPNLWTEIRWAARQEGIQHLDDLLLRRVRIGLLLENGAEAHLERLRSIIQPELGWSDSRWAQEVAVYRQIWRNSYSPCPIGYTQYNVEEK